MNTRRIASTATLLSLLAGTAAGMSTAPEPPPTRQPSDLPTGQNSATQGPRAEAELSYALSYEEIGKAKKDVEANKTKNAEKHFRKAVDYGEKAVSLDDQYHEAWNLIGFASRKLGDYDKAFKAYDRCLTLKPDYAAARAYVGEAWLEKGDAKKAREQLIWLERLGAEIELKNLQASYDAWVAAHPDSATVAPAAAEPAKVDSATVVGGGGR